MTSTFVIIERLYCCHFKCNCLKNQSVAFFIAFLKSTLNFEHFQKTKFEPHVFSIYEIIYIVCIVTEMHKTWLLKCIKGLVSLKIYQL